MSMLTQEGLMQSYVDRAVAGLKCIERYRVVIRHPNDTWEVVGGDTWTPYLNGDGIFASLDDVAWAADDIGQAGYETFIQCSLADGTFCPPERYDFWGDCE